jgi:hypothetical protein
MTLGKETAAILYNKYMIEFPNGIYINSVKSKLK